ncbi:MAG: hypothetical protein NTZ79_09650, partial [Proteobacteria bacterium]|nr:hypothetical protein [Pseudomonadota bacterium]
MNTQAPQRHDDVGECVDAALRRVGKRIVLATPLAIGKPNAVLNEFYRRVARDPSLHLTIFTALSLNRPVGKSELERRFLGPLVERVFGDYPDLEYVRALRAGTLPANIQVRHFYVQAGAWLGVESVQHEFTSVNYSHVVRDLVELGVNVLAQQVAARSSSGRNELSLSCNPDLTLDLFPCLDQARASGAQVVTIGAVNRRLPFMLGDAVIPEARFDLLLDHERYDHDPYCPPQLPIRDVEHALGLNAAALVRDGGTLQLGIGELGEACVYGLQLRQQRNDVFRAALAATGVSTRSAQAIERLGGLAPFDRGLYACTEMFIDGFLELYRSGILARRVYPHATLQRLLDDGVITERIDVELLVALSRAGIEWLDPADFDGLQRAGLFLPGTRLAARGVL